MIFYFPPTAQISKVKITNVCNTSVNEAFNGYQSVMSIGAQWFEFDLSVTASQLEIREFDAFISKLNGRLNTFSVSIPKRFTCYDDRIAGDISADSSKAGASKISISGITRGAFTAGDFIQFGNSAKLYMVTDYDKAKAELSIMPRLRKQLPVGTPLLYKAVKAELRLESDDTATSFKQSHDIAEYKVKAREAF